MDKKAFEEHSIWNLIQQAEDSLKSFGQEARLHDAYKETVERVRFVKWLLQQSDHRLIEAGELNQLQSGPMQQIVNAINGSSDRPGHLSQTTEHYKSIIAKFPYPRVRKIFKSDTAEIADEFRQQIEIIAERLSEQSAAIQSSLDQSSTKLAELEEVQNALNQRYDEIKARVDEKSEEVDQKFEAQVTERMTELNSRFEESQTSQRAEVEKQLDRISSSLSETREQLDKLKTSSRDQIETAGEELEKWMSSATEEADKTLLQIKNIFQVAGQTALAGDFENAAKDENKQANIFAFFAALFYVATPLFFAVQWYHLEFKTFEPLETLGRILSSAVFLVPAVYFGSTAQRHRRVAVALRSLGVRVATFDSYLANLDKTQADKIRSEMAQVFFAANISPDRLRQTSSKEIEKSLDLVGSALEKAESSIKAAITTSGS
ncbi:MAG: apolipoprotein A1/A4/E family protein [Alphaproteobacteria bacterium]|nr:apolipoprotein A1/A4/E family protein [Alphaproteobacteria bacterium]